MEEHRFAKLGDLPKSVTLGQNPLPQLLRLARLDALREGQERVDAGHDEGIDHFTPPFGPRGSTVSGRQT